MTLVQENLRNKISRNKILRNKISRFCSKTSILPFQFCDLCFDISRMRLGFYTSSDSTDRGVFAMVSSSGTTFTVCNNGFSAAQNDGSVYNAT